MVKITMTNGNTYNVTGDYSQIVKAIENDYNGGFQFIELDIGDKKVMLKITLISEITEV